MRLRNMRFLSKLTLLSMGCFLLTNNSLTVFAESDGHVVINEVAWAGSVDSASDEWIELYNPTSSDVDLSGWVIEDDDNGVYEVESGLIKAYGYFLIESREEAVKTVDADYVVKLSLANAGDKLVLKNNNGDVVDVVNSSGGEWFAGGGDQKISMERIDPLVSGDDGANWLVNRVSIGELASVGGVVSATPKALNSVSDIASGMARLGLVLDVASYEEGGIVKVRGEAKEIAELFAYGVDVEYDPQVLKFIRVHKGGFMSDDGVVDTAFQSGLEDGQSGKLLIAEAMIDEGSALVSGDGRLFEVEFEILNSEARSFIRVMGESFMASSSDDLAVNWVGSLFFDSSDEGDNSGDGSGDGAGAGSTNEISEVSDLKAEVADKRYAFKLSWTNSEGDVDAYQVLRKSSTGEFIKLVETQELEFTDSDDLINGGGIISGVEYVYRVVAVSGDEVSNGVDVFATDNRGIKGDSDRSDRVDGRDLKLLASYFGKSVNLDDKAQILLDTSYDGVIDANDLLDLTANWALTYSEQN